MIFRKPLILLKISSITRPTQWGRQTISLFFRDSPLIMIGRLTYNIGIDVFHLIPRSLGKCDSVKTGVSWLRQVSKDRFEGGSR